MTNYLAIVYHESATDRLVGLRNSLESLGHFDEEHLEIAIAPKWRMIWISPSPKNDVNLKRRAIFSGFALDTARQRIVISVDGLEPSSIRSSSGCFVTCNWSADEFAMHHDIMGSLPLYASCEAGVLIASDSCFVVQQARRMSGLSVTVNEAYSQAMQFRHSITAETFATQTLCDEITYLTPGSRIQLTLDDSASIPAFHFGNLPEIFSFDAETYVDVIRSMVLDIAGVARAISTETLYGYRLGLTGGGDSRAILGAVLLTEEGRSRSVFSTARVGSWNDRDFEVSSRLADEIGFHLGPEPGIRPPTKRMPDSLRLWYANNIASYHPIAQSNLAIMKPGYFSTSGHGGELFTKFFGPRSLQSIEGSVRNANPLWGEGFGRLTREFCDLTGLDFSAPHSAEWHYLAFRSPIHGSRGTSLTKFSLHPLMDPRIAGFNKVLGARPISALDRPVNPVADMTIIADTRLASFEYDKPEKNLTHDYISDRLRELGGSVTEDEVPSYSFDGGLDNVSIGPCKTLLALVPGFVPPGTITRESVSDMVESAIRRNDLSNNIVSYLTDAARKQLEIKEKPVNHTWGGMGKLLAYLEVAN